MDDRLTLVTVSVRVISVVVVSRVVDPVSSVVVMVVSTVSTVVDSSQSSQWVEDSGAGVVELETSATGVDEVEL